MPYSPPLDPALIASVRERIGTSYRTLYRKVRPDTIPTRIPANPFLRRSLELAKEGKKWCCGCEAPRPAKDFSPQSGWCKTCAARNTRAHYQTHIKTNPERYKAHIERNRKYQQTPAGKAALERGQLRRRARFHRAYVEDVDRAFVWERDGGVCGLCGENADPASWHLDHILPLAQGGTHEYANVQVAHPRCNLSKGCRITR